MIEKIVNYSILHPFRILLLTLIVAAYGIYSFTRLPIDAVPDITNNQVQINTLLPGYSPAQVEKQATYIIETALAGVPRPANDPFPFPQWLFPSDSHF